MCFYFRQEKTSIGDVPSADDPAVIVLSTSSYIRYRSVAKRIAGRERQVCPSQNLDYAAKFKLTL